MASKLSHKFPKPVKPKTNKTMSAILSFIKISYLSHENQGFISRVMTGEYRPKAKTNFNLLKRFSEKQQHSARSTKNDWVLENKTKHGP